MPNNNQFKYSARCCKCGRLLGYMNAEAEIKCDKCRVINLIDPQGIIQPTKGSMTSSNDYYAIVGGSA